MCHVCFQVALLYKEIRDFIFKRDFSQFSRQLLMYIFLGDKGTLLGLTYHMSCCTYHNILGNAPVYTGTCLLVADCARPL